MYPDFTQYLRMQNLFGTPDPSTGMYPVSDPTVNSVASMQPQPTPAGPAPYDIDARMKALYHPDTTFSDKFAAMMGNYPKQAEASTGRKVAGAALGALTDIGNSVGAIGHGSSFRTMPASRSGEDVFNEVTGRKKFLEDVADWRNQIAPLEQAANTERQNNNTQRLMAHQVINSELTQQKQAEKAQTDADKTAIARSRMEIYRIKTEQPDMKFDFKGETVLAANPKTGKVIDTGIPTSHLSDQDKMDLGHENKMEEIKQTGKNAQTVEGMKETHADTLAWSDPYQITKEDGTKAYYQTNKVSGAVRQVAFPGEASKIGTPTQNTGKISAQTQAMMEGSKMLLPHVPKLQAQAEALDKAGLFGPVMSRIRDIGARVGTLGIPGHEAEDQAKLEQFQQDLATDPELNKDFATGQFATNLGLMASGAGRVHGGARGGGSPQMINYMKSLLSSDSTLPMFKGRLNSLEDYLKTYAAGPNATPTNDKIGSILDKMFPKLPVKR